MTATQDKIQARAQLFQLLALGFLHPVAEFHQLMINGSYPLALTRAAYRSYGIDSVIGQPDQPLERFEADYIHLFQMGDKGRPIVGLNAGDHEELLGSGSRPEFLLDYSAWYRHFGLTTSEDEHSNELPDHISCQFELLAWLAHLEYSSQDNPDRQADYQRAQRDFTQRHVLEYLELLVAALERTNDNSHTQKFFLNLSTLSLEAVSAMHKEFTKVHGGMRDKVITTDQTEPVNLWG
ncbi:MAG: molecular chaperone TorD family protein [Halioglobus sp.]